jgi:hypothetical protein
LVAATDSGARRLDHVDTRDIFSEVTACIGLNPL